MGKNDSYLPLAFRFAAILRQVSATLGYEPYSARARDGLLFFAISMEVRGDRCGCRNFRDAVLNIYPSFSSLSFDRSVIPHINHRDGPKEQEQREHQLQVGFGYQVR